MKARRIKGLDPAGPVADQAQRIVAVRLDELFTLAAPALEPGATEELHDLRIAAKRLRYVLEVTAPCFGAYARSAVKVVKELQGVLGEIHDCDVALPEVLALVDELREQDAAVVVGWAGRRKGLDPALAAASPHADAWRGLEALAIHQRARREQLVRRFRARWRALERDGFRARLEYAISERPVGNECQEPAP